MKAELRVVTLRETESDINSNNKSTWKDSPVSVTSELWTNLFSGWHLLISIQLNMTPMKTVCIISFMSKDELRKTCVLCITCHSNMLHSGVHVL